MPFPSVTYTFSNATTADATQVNQNFTDLINGISDGSKNINVSAGTFAGTLTANGNATFGTSSANTVTFNAALLSSILLNTTFAYDIGGASVGLRSIYLGSNDAAARSVRVIAPAVGTSYSFTLPTAVASLNRSVLLMDTSGNLTTENKTVIATTSKSTTYAALNTDEMILVTCPGGSWTLSLPAAASNTGKIYKVKKTDTVTNTITIDPNGSETIDGNTTVTLMTQNEQWDIISDGTNWQVINHYTQTPWIAYTPTVTGMGTVTNVSFFYKRDGDTVFVRGSFTNGTVAASLATLTLPGPAAALGIDTTKISIANTNAAAGPTMGDWFNAGTNDFGSIVTATGSSSVLVYLASNTNTANNLLPNNGNTLSGNNTVTTVKFAVPIASWF